MERTLFWAYVSFSEIPGGKKRPVLVLRKDKSNYIVFRLTSKYKNKSDYIKSKYIEVKDWKKSNLPKPSWIDTIQTYELPIATTKLEYIGNLTKSDLTRLIDSL